MILLWIVVCFPLYKTTLFGRFMSIFKFSLLSGLMGKKPIDIAMQNLFFSPLRLSGMVEPLMCMVVRYNSTKM